ncbi:unnamed protein product [Ilex paraguariensis]|uniref:Pentatricopeptide repeat-containing protein n=1 Tax=Ilex paraguariensis TaxID=185542 RepID=A0ABC8UL55_9AQUA
MSGDQLQKQIPPKPPDVSKTFASLFTSPKNSVLFLNPTTCSGLVLGSNSDIVPVYYGKISSMPPSIYKVDQNSSSNQIPSNVQIPSFTQISSVTHIPSNGKILSNSHNPSSVLVSSSDSFPSNVQISSISQIPSIVQVSSISHESLVNPVSGQIASDIPGGTLRNLISSVEAPKPAKRVVYNNGELGMYWSLEETQQLSKGFHQSLIGKCAYGKPSVGVIKEFIKSNKVMMNGRVKKRMETEAVIANKVTEPVKERNKGDEWKGPKGKVVGQEVQRDKQKMEYRQKSVIPTQGIENRFAVLDIDVDVSERGMTEIGDAGALGEMNDKEVNLNNEIQEVEVVEKVVSEKELSNQEGKIELSGNGRQEKLFIESDLGRLPQNKDVLKEDVLEEKDSSFLVDYHYDARKGSGMSLDDEMDLVRSKEPPNKGYLSDVGSSKSGEWGIMFTEDQEESNDFNLKVVPSSTAHIGLKSEGFVCHDQHCSDGLLICCIKSPKSLYNVVNLIPEFCFQCSLQVSQWMTDKRYIPLMQGDIANRLNLICRVHGLEEAEKYFKNIPQILKGYEVYLALLNCYAHDKTVEKSETFMQKLRDMGYARTPRSYNIMMNLYYQMKSWEKLDTLVHEMEEKGIYFDYYTYSIRLSAYAAASDIEGMDKIVTKMESDHRVTLDYFTYAVAAGGYLKVGLVDKALAMLSKLEGQMISTKKRNVAFDCLLRLYAGTGKKDELHRIWNLYKKEKIFNKGYMTMMSSLSKFNAIEDAEKIFEEWESRGLAYDFRIPNCLIDVYCRNGFLGKAESLLERGIANGGNPSANTWCSLAGGYIENNQVANAVEALKKAILICPSNWKPSKETLSACLEFLERRGDVEEAEEFIEQLKTHKIFSAAVHDRLLSCIRVGKTQS